MGQNVLTDEDGDSLIKTPMKLVSKAYLLPWYTTKKNVVIKGSKGSGKSYFAALWIIYNIMAHPHSSALVIRKVGDSIADSCYKDLKDAIVALKVSHLWTCTYQPLRMRYKTGQEIMFRGFDDPYKLASIRAPAGCYLCWVWFEEAFDITDYSAVLKVQMSIRAIPEWTGLKKRFIFTFNPWHQYHWLKTEFFDKERDDTLAVTTTYLDNPAFNDDDRKGYEDLAKFNPIQARVIVYGEWGTSEGLIYNNWKVETFDPEEIRAMPDVQELYGLDFGYAISYNAFVAMLVNVKTHDLWIYDQMYQNGMTNLDIAVAITNMGYSHKRIVADCAEPKSIEELRNGITKQMEDGSFRRYSLPNIEPALKGRDSVVNGIQRLQTFRIHVLHSCRDVIMEFSSYAWKKDKDGKFTGDPEKEHDHAMDAIRYPTLALLRNHKGWVAVAKGRDDTPRSPVHALGMGRAVEQEEEAPVRKCKRVAATHE